MRALNVFLAFVTSLVIAFGLFEAGLRLFPDFRPQPVINRFDSKLGWSKTPGETVTRGTSEFSVEFEINELGLRDDPMPSTRKSPGTFRVLMLGDSFVLGYTVDREHLFVDHLEHWWTEEGRKVDVVNAGTEGYSTDQEVQWFLEHGIDFEPDLVCIFPYENDIYWCGQPDYNGKAKPLFRADGTLETGTLADTSRPAPFLMKLAFGQFLTKTVLPLLPRGGGPSPHQFVPGGQPGGAQVAIPKEFAPLLVDTPAFLKEAEERTKGALIALQKGCKKAGARLLMVPIPSESAIHDEARAGFAQAPFGMNGLDESLWSPDQPVDRFLAVARETIDRLVG